MLAGDIVYYPINGLYIKYIVKMIDDDQIIVTTYKSKQLNWLSKSDVISAIEFKEKHKNEIIYE